LEKLTKLVKENFYLNLIKKGSKHFFKQKSTKIGKINKASQGRLL